MSNQTNKLTDERIKQYANDERMCNVNDEVREMARRLLAAEAELQEYRKASKEPVAWEVKGILCHTLAEANQYVGEPEPLYAAPPLQAVPDGWQLVPKDMTDEIGEAIAKEAGCCGGIALDVYEAMLAAAPQPSSNPSQLENIKIVRW